MDAKSNKRRFFIPEVVQTSGMDCGPASLKSLMDGLGVSANYGRLREACQTDVDGTSIDTLEVIANELGMDAQQIMLPADHIFIPSANVLPALIVIQLPNLATHFIVVWRTVGGWVQIMDPACGRTWRRKQELLNEIYRHSMPVPADAWRDWAGTDEFLLPLQARMQTLGVNEVEGKQLIEQARADSGWKSIASLDASTRMLTSLVDARGLSKGKEAQALLLSIYKRALSEPNSIPDHFWGVRFIEGDPEQPMLELRGAVALRVRKSEQEPGQVKAQPASEALSRVLNEPQPSALKVAVQSLREEGWLFPSLLLIAMLLSGFGLMFEALLLRGLIDIGQELGAVQQRLSAAGAMLVFAFALLLIEFPTTAGVLKIGRSLEARLRIAIYKKIPRLNDRYFQSRLTSDMAERAHTLHTLKHAPILAEQILRLGFALLFTTCGIIWLAPDVALWAILAMLLAFLIPWFSLSLMDEKDMQVRTHEGALSRFYLDALLGLTALRSHSAYKPVSLEHEGMLVEWMRAGYGMRFISVLVEGAQLLVGFGFAAIILIRHFDHAAGSSTILLLTYWALYIPVLGQRLAQEARQIPENKNRLLRLLEPLTAQEEFATDASASHTEKNRQKEPCGKKIELLGVSLVVSGHHILHDINLTIESGKHVAVVGPSGAGKSSFVGLLLGWYRPATGEIKVDGEALDQKALMNLRTQTVWIDPGVQLWNQTLFNNIRYGQAENNLADFAKIIDDSDLLEVLQRLLQGMQTRLGEGGRLVSGGEGQRVRLARALNKPEASLVILDEAFRGLERHQRISLLNKLRQNWRNATFIHISHDIRDTANFEEVIVVEHGTIAEYGSPSVLMKQKDSCYARLLEADIKLHEKLWRGATWRRWRMQEGKVNEVAGEDA